MPKILKKDEIDFSTFEEFFPLSPWVLIALPPYNYTLCLLVVAVLAGKTYGPAALFGSSFIIILAIHVYLEHLIRKTPILQRGQIGIGPDGILQHIGAIKENRYRLNEWDEIDRLVLVKEGVIRLLAHFTDEAHNVSFVGGMHGWPIYVSLKRHGFDAFLKRVEHYRPAMTIKR